MAKILVVEDDLEMASIIEDWLSHENYVVELLHNGMEAEIFLQTSKCDAVVLSQTAAAAR